jgi:hypothetical protein
LDVPYAAVSPEQRIRRAAAEVAVLESAALILAALLLIAIIANYWAGKRLALREAATSDVSTFQAMLQEFSLQLPANPRHLIRFTNFARLAFHLVSQSRPSHVGEADPDWVRAFFSALLASERNPSELFHASLLPPQHEWVQTALQHFMRPVRGTAPMDVTSRPSGPSQIRATA